MSQNKQQRLGHVDKAKKLSVARQCELIEVTRSSFYYKPAGESTLNLELMRLIDEKHLLHPWLGVPRMTTWLQEDKGYKINPKRIERLYKLMGLSATGPKPNTSKKGKGKCHRVYKYLLRKLKIERINQVWAMDITYNPRTRWIFVPMCCYRCLQSFCGRLVFVQYNDFGMVQTNPSRYY